MKQYDAYLFDWDGTTAQTLAMWLSIQRATMDAYGIHVTDKELVRKVFGRARPGLIELGIPEADLSEVFRQWGAKAQAGIVDVPLYPHFADVIKTLQRRSKKLGLITATARPTIERALDAHSLHGVFSTITAGGEAPDKPNPAGILQALEKLGVTKSRAVMLGDSEKDIQAAHNAGIDSVLFYPPEHELFHHLDDLQAYGPTHTIHSWQELLDQLQ